MITSESFVIAPSISGRKAGPYRWRTNEASFLRGLQAETLSINRPFLGFAATNAFHCSGKCSAHPSLSRLFLVVYRQPGNRLISSCHCNHLPGIGQISHIPRIKKKCTLLRRDPTPPITCEELSVFKELMVSGILAVLAPHRQSRMDSVLVQSL